MNNSADQPLYFIPPEHPAIGAYKESFEMFANHADKKFKVAVPPGVVEDGQVYMFQEVVLALQHYPQYIEKFLFGFEFEFQQVEDGELYWPEDYWKTNTDYYRWFHKMADFMPVFFFLNDKDARFYCLIGDLLAEQKVSAQPIKDRKEVTISLNDEQVKLMRQRVGTVCHYFYLYCHGSGFDAKPCVEAVLEEYLFPGIAESVYERYREDVKGGIKFRATPSKR